MSGRRIFVYGASGHGKVVADILLALGDSDFVGFIDDNAELQGANVLGLPVYSSEKWLEQASQTRAGVALGVGDGLARQRVAQKVSGWGMELVTVVHPTASVSASARLDAGVVVMAQAAINPCATIGRGAVINTGALIDHDVEVGHFSQVAPNAAMGGCSSLGDLSFLGMGATVIQKVRIGSKAIIGAGSAVVRNIPDSVIAHGVPARIRRVL